VADGTRTRDHRDHNPGLYQLSYRHRAPIIVSAVGRAPTVHLRQVNKRLPDQPHDQECQRRKPCELSPDDDRQDDEVRRPGASRASPQTLGTVGGGQALSERFDAAFGPFGRAVTVAVISVRGSSLVSPGRAQFVKSRNRYIAHRR
jgi:hypothetical protein